MPEAPLTLGLRLVRHGTMLGAASLLVACSASSDERLAHVERDAAQRIARAQREADRKVTEAEQRLAAVKAELDRKQAELDRTLQAESRAFEADRKTFEQQCRATFERLDQEMHGLAVKVNAGVNATLDRVAEQRSAVERDLAELGVATREGYAELKQRINRDLASFEHSVDTARKKPSTKEPRR
jgi:hypothetical protein